MNPELVRHAAAKFVPFQAISIEPLGNGLIHQTYKITFGSGHPSIVLQSINRTVFKDPEAILHNYNEVYQFLLRQEQVTKIPAPIKAGESGLLWTDPAGNCWRATAFIEHSYSPMTAPNEESAHTVARSFAGFTASLSDLDTRRLKIIILGFHDLSLRYRQFEESLEKASIERLLKSTHVIAELRQRKFLVDFFEMIRDAENYPVRVMHHDCKISNILFEESTDRVICPVDLDTVMPGKYFSDPGDMIRTMACTVDENSSNWEEIQINPSFYRAILEGYLEGMHNFFSDQEHAHIHHSGLIMIYMQAIRFLSDFLNGDEYYKTSYPEQNLNRALNQLILLEKLEDFLFREYAVNAQTTK